VDLKEQKILSWIERVSKVRPDLGGFAICPFAAKSKYKIIECSSNNIEPINGYDVLIFIIEDHLVLKEVQQSVAHYNDKYPTWKFFEDCKSYPTFINGLQTNNKEFNLILAQPKEKLRKFREQLAKTDYYRMWDDNYLKEILGGDLDVLGDS